MARIRQSEAWEAVELPCIALAIHKQSVLSDGHFACVVSWGDRLLPSNLGDKVAGAELLVENDAASVRLDMVEVNPHGSIRGKQRADLPQPVTEHR